MGMTLSQKGTAREPMGMTFAILTEVAGGTSGHAQGAFPGP